jgi:hypothetical protein
MARYTNELVVETLKEHMQPDETLEHFAYGVKQPNIFLIIVLFALAILPGVIAVALLTKEYVIGLTDKRLLVLRVKGKIKVLEVSEYDRANLPQASAKTGPIFTYIRIKDEARPFAAKFHRAGMTENRPNAVAIGEALAPA